MFNLAAYRYRQVLAEFGGPIARLQLADMVVLGRREFFATAFLREGMASELWRSTLFGIADGGGTSPSPMIARFKAISEALERWAHWQTHQSVRRPCCGFEVDPSSNGMAAFPGIFSRQARPYALMEAAERFNLLNWWEGRLAAVESGTCWPGVRSVTICSDAPGVTVILFRKTAHGLFAYGHAAAWDYAAACRKAGAEMVRHEMMVEQFALAQAGNLLKRLPDDAHAMERRALFFATAAGHELFQEHLCAAPVRARVRPKLVYDGPVPGPWSRYASVWRVVYEPPSERFLQAEENYFLW